VVVVEADRRRDRMFELVDLARCRWPTAPIVVLLGPGGAHPATDSAQRGDLIFVDSTATTAELALLIRQVSAGTSGPARFASRRNAALSLSKRRNSPNGLTERELHVVRLVVAGESIDSLAHTLSVSVHTARKHLQNAMYKIGVRSRVGVLAWAREAGLDAWSTRRADHGSEVMS
jgi:DNA-binding NarL/FixJ family response regulator